MINKIKLIINTVKYLKAKQIVYQVIYKLKPKKNLKQYFCPKEFKINKLKFIEFPSRVAVYENKRFVFLNLEQKFDGDINWNFNDYGKLWNYNLQYLNYLTQPDLSEDFKLDILHQIHSSLKSGELALEPYPVSLRIINTIRFLNSINTSNQKYYDIIKSVYQQSEYLVNNLEYHILGNHLLENAFALLVSSEFFGNKKWSKVANTLLVNELKNQVLNDGAHFELSPMYHQIIYARVLEAISITSNNVLRQELLGYASKMLGWLTLITFKNGSIPHFNDSTEGIANTSNELFKLSEELGIKEAALMQFNESGYRKFAFNSVELYVDVNGIAPTYQPGHAHSDHLSFVFNYLDKPILIDPSISTYNISKRRTWERSSAAHNTVTINNANQSEVWGGFRVAKRAQVKIITENQHSLSADIKYSIGNEKIIHKREINTEKLVVIKDSVNSEKEAIARYYLHPNIYSVEILGDEVKIDQELKFVFNNYKEITLQKYTYALEYNKLIESIVIEVKFVKFLELEIIIPN